MTYGIRDTNPLPVAGQAQWDSAVNAKLQAHDDTLAQRVGVDGLDINGTLDAQGNAVINVSNVRFFTGGDPGVANSVFISSGDLFVRDGSNRLVQVTSGGAVNVAGSGGFGGDYVSSNQNGASFTNATNTFTFTVSGGTVYATIEGGSLKVHNGSSAQAITLSAPATLGSSYTVTLPTSVPLTGGPTVLRFDATGSLQAAASASFSASIPVAWATPVSVGGGLNFQSNTGWSFGTGDELAIGVPYEPGDRIDSVSLGFDTGATGGALTGTLWFVSDAGNKQQLAQVSFNAVHPGALRTIGTGTPTLTGSFPVSPPTTGTLTLSVKSGGSPQGLVLFSAYYAGMRRTITS